MTQSGVRKTVHRATTLIVRLSAVLLFAVVSGVAQTREGPVWFWFATCDGPVMTLEVQLDQATLFHSTIPLCRSARDASASQGQSRGRIQFPVRPPRSLQWEGYRDPGDRTRANQTLTMDLWQAAADPNALLISIGVRDDRRSYMNTIHIA